MSFSGTKGYITKPKPGVMLNPLHPLSRGLVGCWLFNEGSGSKAYDISVKNNHGTLKNMVPNIQGSGWGGSKFGGGLQFDGVNDYVDAGASFIKNNSTFSVAMWFKADDTSVVSHLFWEGESTENGWGPGQEFHISIASANDPIADGIAIVLCDSSNSNERADVYYPFTDTSNWHYVVGVIVNDIDAYLYLDGVFVGTNSANDSVIKTNMDTNVRIGRPGANMRYFNGIIDSVCIYDRALSATEVKQLYQNPFCNLLQVPIRRYSVTPPVGVIMNQFQKANLGADLYNGVFA